MNPIKAFAKIYGNYFLTVQGVKVMKTIKDFLRNKNMIQ